MQAKLKKIIIQGDDLGYSPVSDSGIKYAYEHGILTSTTVMANLLKRSDKKKYREYVNKLENKSGLEKPELGIGVHLNVTYGKPLSSKWPQKEFTRPFRNSGKPEEWQGSVWRKYFSQFTERQVEDEYRTQIEFALEFFGKIDHLDSHHFTASYAPLTLIYEKMAKQYNLPVRPSAPLSENPVYGGDFLVDNNFVNNMKKKKIKVADKYILDLFFNEADPIKMFLGSLSNVYVGETCEIMFHPAKGEIAEEWRLKDLETLTNSKVISYFKVNNIELINYSLL
ncbi:MAG: hypothetical protein US60_C0017G0018 [Microgenomates group bacterium GW2011_GWC1_37_8]|uniref:YdjC family protein n=1 Tax=Candidatus Woesebacteria bacterium GW2011_GWB1_38_8 TaxID=1618570 RepID=A0A0G0L2J7_9BACT|nr:MAG: hypothetical protein US60_C0017G0018 [Microgenomates group bacterium GW2011_GWC1_37_8]KKQ86188.1 MAG: hypothetical protein UT08_C0001G0054 [Candidatus Woesebacteria bacterium GW2011_GWB1_38_8]